MASKNTICLWYDGAALDAARFYAETFPDSAVGAVMRAPGDYPDGEGEGYAAIHREYIDPIAQAQALSQRISIAVANLFGAHG